MKGTLAAAAILLAVIATPAAAACYDWPLRVGHSGGLAYDADTIYITMSVLPEELQPMSVRLNGIDTPEIRGKCEAEKDLAVRARDFVLALLEDAESVRFCQPKWGKYAGRVLADVEIDGENLTGLLIERGFGRPYDGGPRQGWCE